jgi:serine/threonine protein kinase
LKLDDKLKDAEGVFGEVRHGKYFGADIAVKRAKPETKKERKTVYQAFLREAKTLGDLGNHPNIVKLIGISPMLKDEFYIVMEYCDNGDALSYLQKVYREESPKAWIRAILKLCIGVCDAMSYIHSKGYTHRDITASNILVKGGRAMLSDLGLARKSVPESSDDPNESFGMPANHSMYAPPELKQFPDLYTPGCDVYCFGIALFEMLARRRWTREDVINVPQVLDELDSLQIPVFFKTIISQCWHEEDLFRPTFTELLTEFTQLYNQEWSQYRLVIPGPNELPLLTNQSLAGHHYRIVSFSAEDIVANDAYQTSPSTPHHSDKEDSTSYRIADSFDRSMRSFTERSMTNFAFERSVSSFSSING